MYVVACEGRQSDRGSLHQRHPARRAAYVLKPDTLQRKALGALDPILQKLRQPMVVLLVVVTLTAVMTVTVFDDDCLYGGDAADDVQPTYPKRTFFHRPSCKAGLNLR